MLMMKMGLKKVRREAESSLGKSAGSTVLFAILICLDRYFAGEIIGNVMEIEARRWRRPKRVDFRMNKERVAEFRKKYDKFDWTGMIASR